MPKVVVVAVAAYFTYGASLAWTGSALAASLISAVVSGYVATLIAPSYDTSLGSTGFNRGLLVTSRQAAGSWRVIYGQTRVGGIITFLQGSTDNQYLHIVLTLSGHVLQEITTVYFNDKALTLDGNGNVTAPAQYVGFVRIKKSLGDETSQPFPNLVSESNGLWTDAHRQNGRGKVYVRLLFNSNAFPQGVPNVTALVRGRKVFDPRSDTTYYTPNAALCLADYLTNTDFGCGMVYATEIDDAALIAAANTCDESVTILAGTEARYTCNGAFVTDESPEQILPRLLTAMAGRIAYIAGQWKIYAGAYVTPTLTLDQNDLAGPIKIIPRLSKRDLFNRVRGVYIDPNRLYQETDFPPIINSTYLSQDNNEQLWMEMNLPFTQSAPTAQRIAKIELERCRQQIAVLMRCKLGVYRLQPGDTVMVSLERYGWEQKVFEVQDVRLAVDNGALVVDITAREHTSAVFTWGVSEESEVDPAPDTNLPDPFNVLPPSALSIVEENYEAIGSGGLKTKVTASWTAPNDFFTQSGLAIYQLEYKLAADSTWIVVTNIKSTTYTILDFPPGFYNFRVKAFNVTGVASPYSGTTAYDVVGLTAPPTSVQSFSAHPTAGLVQFTWAPHPDIDVRIGGKIEVRHTSVNSYTWPDSSLIGRYDGIATSGFGPLVQGTYLAKALDTAAVYSNTFAAFPVNEVLFTGFTTVASVVEHTTFVGTKVNLQVTASRLEMTDPSSLTATYFFPGSVAAYPTWIDLGSVSARRFESDLQLFRFDDSDLIDSRGAVDTWPSVDGGAVDQGEVLLYLRATDDNPSGAPTWGPWTPFRIAELNCRATQFKAEYVVAQATHNVSASELAVHVRVQS